MIAAVAASGPDVRRVVAHRDWAMLQGKMRPVLSEDDRRRLQPMFQQVCKCLFPCTGCE